MAHGKGRGVRFKVSRTPVARRRRRRRRRRRSRTGSLSPDRRRNIRRSIRRRSRRRSAHRRSIPRHSLSKSHIVFESETGDTVVVVPGRYRMNA